MIKLKNISKYFNNNGNVSIGLNSVNLQLPDNGLIMISGQSGSGKSTLLNILAGLDDYDSGDYLYNNTDILEDEILKEETFNLYSIINQDYRLFSNLTVYENLNIIKNESNSSNHEIDEYLKTLDIFKLKNENVCNISGGEQQRVAIARALLMNKKILLCDEATSNLDKENELIIYSLLKKLSKDHLVLVVTHNKKTLEPFSDGKIIMKNGEIVENNIIIGESSSNTVTINEKIVPSKALIYKSMKMTSKLISLSIIYTLFLSFFLVLSSYFSYTNTKNSREYLSSNIYTNNDPLRIVIDGIDENISENDVLKSVLNKHKYLYDDYILEYGFSLYKENVIQTNSKFYEKYKFNFSPVLGYNYEIICGSLPTNENEIFMLGDFSDKLKGECYTVSDMLGTEFVFRNTQFKISGIAQIKTEYTNLESEYCVLYSENILSLLSNIETKHLEIKDVFNQNIGTIGINNKLEDNTIYTNNISSLDKVYCMSKKIDLSAYELVERPNYTANYTLIEFNQNTYDEILNSINTRLTIYLNDIKEKGYIIDILSDYNISVPYDYNYNYEESSNMNHYKNITILIGLSLTLIYMSLRLFFIYLTKKKISILTLIGISKKDIIEVSTIKLFIEVSILIIITIIGIVISKTVIPSLSNDLYLTPLISLLIFFDIIFYYILTKKNVNSLYLSEVK